ncbi:MAG: hypothetical protein ACNA71_03765 [Kiritimatiellia bacterium]
MYTKSMRIMLALCTLSMLGITPAASASKDDIVVIPARARMVKLGFDLQTLRGPTLISYRDTDEPLQPLVHVWNRSRRQWQEIEVSQIAQSTMVPPRPHRVYAIGLPGMIPETLLVALSNASELHMLQTFSVAEILTTLDQEMSFSMAEWRSLGARHNLDVTEVNVQQRRWGRFGPPRRYRQEPAPEQQLAPTQSDESDTTILPSRIKPHPIEMEKHATPPEPRQVEPLEREAKPEEPVTYEETVAPVMPPEETVPMKGTDTDAPETTAVAEEDFPIK